MMPSPTSCDAHNDARSFALSAPSRFRIPPKTGTAKLFSTMSTVFASPLDATALAANGPPPARSQVVISMYSVRRPASLMLPVTIASMKSGVESESRSRRATGSINRRDCSPAPTTPGSPASQPRSTRHAARGFIAPYVRAASLLLTCAAMWVHQEAMQPTFGVDEEFLLTDPETREPVAKK